MVGFMKSALNLFGLSKKDGVDGVDLEAFLTELPTQLGFDIQFKKIEKDEPGLHFEVEGSELNEFLGESCEMLDALANIAMRVLRRQAGLSNANQAENEEAAAQLRVTFDAQGFRAKAAEELKALAVEHRQKVIDAGGKPSYIRALGPADRKIIHTALAELGEVTSESIGRGPFKRIRVVLVDGSTFRREQPRSADGNGNGQGGQGRGGQRGGQRGGGQGRGGQGRNGNPNRARRDGGPSYQNNDAAFNNSNTVQPTEEVDDNIGNRLAPGEEPPFKF